MKKFLRRKEVDMISSMGLQDKNIVIEKPKSLEQFYIVILVDRKSL